MCFKWKIAQIRVSDEDFDLKIESQTASNGYTQAGKLKIKQKNIHSASDRGLSSYNASSLKNRIILIQFRNILFNKNSYQISPCNCQRHGQ